jgi:hypothetical protein
MQGELHACRERTDPVSVERDLGLRRRARSREQRLAAGAGEHIVDERAIVSVEGGVCLSEPLEALALILERTLAILGAAEDCAGS